jgi:hypothetical protein
MSKKVLAPILSVAAVLALAVALNPSAERHRTKINEAIAERSPVARSLALGSLAAFASTYHSLGVASYTSVGERTLSIGFMGIVYVRQ